MKFPFPRVFISAADQTGRFRSYTFCTIYGTKLIELLPDYYLFEVINDGPELTELARQIGPKTNPLWVTARAAETLYLRGVIDECRFKAILYGPNGIY